MGIVDLGSVLGDSSRPCSSGHNVPVCPSLVSSLGGQVLAEPMAGGGVRVGRGLLWSGRLPMEPW